MPSPITSYTLNVTKSDSAAEHSSMANRLGYIEEELYHDLANEQLVKATSNEMPRVLFDQLLTISPALLSTVYQEVFNTVSDLNEKKATEAEQLQKMKSQFRSFSPICRQMLTLVEVMVKILLDTNVINSRIFDLY